MDTPITTHATTHPTGIIAPHPRLTTSLSDITHGTFPQTGAGLTPALLTALLGEHT